MTETVSDFAEGQWWLQELDAMVASGTDDQKRAVAVVRNLLRTAQSAWSAGYKHGLWQGQHCAPEPLAECHDSDSPWLVCKHCHAAGKCDKQPAASGEPVAWMYQYTYFPDSPEDAPARTATSFHQNPNAPEIAKHTPLYAAQPAPARVPLAHDWDRPDQGSSYIPGYGYIATRAVRAIEAAHGVPPQQEPKP